MSNKDLPSLSGKYYVGTDSVDIVDSSRPAHIKSDMGKRKIFLKVWYPTNSVYIRDHQREGLWAQLDTEPKMPIMMRLLLRKARRKQTNAYLHAPYDNSSGRPRVLLYNHGLISFASENTMLMEHLASYGYTVISIQHRDQLTELQALQKSQAESIKKEQAALQKQIENATGDTKAELSKRYFAMANNTNNIVEQRSKDMAFVVNSCHSILNSIPAFNGHQTPDIIGALGLSLGGAVATEFDKNYGPLPCIINLDGGIYGKHANTPIRSHYLMLYSEANKESNAFCLPTEVDVNIVTQTIANTKHLNFHDIAGYYRSLKWFKIIGSADAGNVLLERNKLVSEFIGKHAEQSTQRQQDSTQFSKPL